MGSIKLATQTQRIVVNPANSSIAIVSAGPIGPRGPVGPSEASLVLNTDGQLLTRASGLLVPITRANLAADTAFISKYVDKTTLTTDGQLLTRAAGIVAPITRASLAADSAFTTKFSKETQGSGAPAGTGTNGDWYYDTTNKRAYRSDGVGWIVMSEPNQAWAASFSSGMTVGNGSFNASTYKRDDGYCDFVFFFTFGSTSVITTPIFNVPFTMANVEQCFLAQYVDAGIQRNKGFASTFSTSTMLLSQFQGADFSITSTAPFTWGTGDVIVVRGRYQMASRYS